MKKLIIICFFIGVLNAQRAMFDIYLFGNDIGDASLNKEVNGDTEVYTFESFTKVSIIVTRTDDYMGKVVVKNGIVESMSVLNKKNGKKQFWTNITKHDLGYKVESDRGISTVSGEIKIFTYKLLYEEPVNITSFFSERFGKYGKILKLEEHKYKFSIAGGEDYTYQYKNGKLYQIDFPTPFGTGNFRTK